LRVKRKLASEPRARPRAFSATFKTLRRGHSQILRIFQRFITFAVQRLCGLGLFRYQSMTVGCRKAEHQKALVNNIHNSFILNNNLQISVFSYLSEIFLTFIRWFLSAFGERSALNFGERGLLNFF
jgi:succinate dehydrogenase/fumarate reductase cytochrome b subunit